MALDIYLCVADDAVRRNRSDVDMFARYQEFFSENLNSHKKISQQEMMQTIQSVSICNASGHGT